MIVVDDDTSLLGSGMTQGGGGTEKEVYSNAVYVL